ncbi:MULTISPECIES: GGDEF domain-containing protein [Clostridium]|uniref:GGDEF domain-containing protein n=1 Tax=Clostridium TaxID=1485 RepID=UPI000DCFD6BA|nr:MULTISPECIES: diguanylate cyclase [Clostridium]MDU3323487.1 diguanylate cyclase [Escherichia coli]MDB2074086.1 diguanylate cyclase [Clostridium paraputrificum]MDB2078060.1 diguanylate cyclase [Clostridium paraputrificum]MDB2093153.1 diguanylate cyclase [Clostridium paraputrificum]MDB2097943.1 diguanylate cyclase [Clostridium paraputrificum]
MNEYKANSRIDISISLLIAYFLILSISFSYLNLGSDIENYIMVTLVMIVALASYYLNRTFVLVIILIIDFVYTSYNFFISVVSDVKIGEGVFFWIVIIPVTAFIVSFLSEEINNLENSYTKIISYNEKFIKVDVSTGLRNISAFMEEMPVYIKLYKRYNVHVSLILVRIKYGNRILKIVGKEYFNKVLVKCSEELSDSLRFEDRKYIVDDDTFAFIIISDKDGASIVKNRLKKSIGELKMGKETLYNDLNIEVQIGSYTINESINDAMEFIERAEKELEYDV